MTTGSSLFHDADPRLGAIVETDEEFLARLRALGKDWRFSDEFIGIVVRTRFPRDYDDGK